jgi:MFS superfamily sulfate permease-like transporter
MKTTIKNDLAASIAVFLVALPLCLGIALASGAPLLSGVISGIIGGIIVGLLSGSQTSVSGPAAGLAAVVLASITQLGSFDIFLIAVFLAGIFQLIAGFLKVGFLANYIPSNVIKGLLAAIGILLILKQVPQALGNHNDVIGDFSFGQLDHQNTISELLYTHNHLAIGSVLITIISLLVLVFYDRTPLAKIKIIPSALIVVVLGIAMNQLFFYYIPLFYMDGHHLVSIPVIDSQTLGIKLPNFSALSNYKVWVVGITIAIVASLETLLNIEAIDIADPHKRTSPTNRELKAQGVGNMLAGLLGGIPITSVIVRSSVNINTGSKTKLSAILHGAFLLLSIVFFSQTLNLIPLSCLAAILIFTGFKLAKPSIFKEMFKKGWSQFIPFVVTIAAIIFTDLLIGIIIGLAVSLFFLLKSNYRNPFILTEEKLHVGETIRLELPSQVSFLNKASLKETLWQIPEGANVIIDATRSDFIDNDILELINDFKTTVSVERQIKLNVFGLKEKYELTDHIQFVNILSKEAQQNLTPQEVLDLLKLGNERFVSGKQNEKYYSHQVDATSHGQNPMAVVISCIDSRTSPDIIFDAGIGDLLSIRIAGNIISPEIIGSIELAVKEIGVKLIVVKGHSHCGAINAAVHGMKENNIGFITTKIEQMLINNKKEKPDYSNETEMEEITRLNAMNSVSLIMQQSPYIRNLLQQNKIGITAAYYDTHSGIVNFEKLMN